MTPREKAIDLINSFEELGKDFTRGVSMNEFAKECALIVVDEILDIDCFDMSEENFDNHIEYWQQVKTELQNL
jgi:hypothetical protein